MTDEPEFETEEVSQEATEVSAEDLVWTIKLINGEDVIGRVVDRRDGTYTVLNPMAISEMDLPDGRTAIAMIKFISGTNWDFMIMHGQNMITMVPVTPELSDYYHKSVEYAIKVSDVNFKKATKMATGQVEQLLRAKLGTDEVPAAISETEFASMPVWGEA